MRNTISTYLRKTAKGALGALAVVAVAFAAPMGAANADTLRIFESTDPTGVDPAFWSTRTDGDLMFNLMPYLAKPAPGREWVLELDAAESIDFSDPLNIKFVLKQGIQWAHGYGELTAEDVKFSFERHLDEDLGSYIAWEYDALTSVEVTGKYSGTIHLSYAAAPMWQSTIGWFGGTIINKKEAMENDGRLPILVQATAGAYTMEEFSPGERVVLKADPNWRGPKPDYDEVILVVVADENAAENAFAAGELDFVRTTVTNAKQLRAQHGDAAVVDIRNTADFTFLGMNVRHENLSDIRVRKAIQMAVDLDSILVASFDGQLDKPATGFAAPGMVGYRPSSNIKRDVETARALIKEAGAEGLTIELSFPNDSVRLTQGQIIQANLAEIGLNIEIIAMDGATYWDNSAVRPMDRQMTLKAWIGNPEAMYGLQYFTEAAFEGWNWEGFDDPEYTKLMNDAWAVTDDEKRGNMYIRMQEIMEESGAFLFVANAPIAAMYHSNMNAGMLPDGRPVFHAFEKK